ncbi:hypothetical protein phiOC_p317 [Ochrobactrum phage vB_OspM_OC]|nr:hypothetical protein phiOC_p317 [Ochrobactrum phage vB_OspM_OC]
MYEELEYVEGLGDFEGTLSELAEIVERAIIKYGGDQKVQFDAGYNNVDVILKKS